MTSPYQRELTPLTSDCYECDGNGIIADHKKMISSVLELPNVRVKIKTKHQADAIQQCKAKWRAFGLQVNYLQIKQLAFRPNDPFRVTEIDPAWREMIDVYGQYLHKVLNLINEDDCWQAIKSAAVSEGREFIFHSPRELFAQICMEQANSEVTEDITSIDINQGPTLTKIRDSLTEFNLFCRGRFNSNPEKEAEILKDFRQSPEWQCFWVYAVWQIINKHASSKEAQYAWKAYLKALKRLINFYKQTGLSGDAKLTTVKWNNGYPVHPELRKPLYFG